MQWGAPGDPSPSCRNREQVLTWYRQGREAGVRAQVTSSEARGDKIVVALRITASGAGSSEGVDRCQVLTVRDGQVVDIRGFERREDAEAMASGER